MVDPIWRNKIQYVGRVLKSIDLHQILYVEFFGVTDHESIARFSNFLNSGSNMVAENWLKLGDFQTKASVF